MTLARGLAVLAVRRGRWVLAIGLALVVACSLLAARLELQTDLAELLPAGAPSVVALRALSTRVGGTGNVAIAIESIDGRPEALRAYVPRLAEALRAQLGTKLLSLRYRRTEIDQFYRRFAAYYVTLADLTTWAKRIDHALALRADPLYVDLDDHDELAAVASELRAARTQLQPGNAVDPETGLFMTEHGRLAVVFVRPAADSLNLAGSDTLLAEIQHIAATTQPAASGVRILGYTGSIPSALSEVEAVRHDIASTSILVVLAVGGVVVLFFRRVRALVVLAAPLVVGIAVALGFAELAFGHLNAQTAFLGTIIVGTGINYGLILLDRFGRARASSPSLEAALETACATTLRATAVAALATAVSFGVLGAGEVESFRQFGWIGGIGILACWLATFTIVPALLVVIDYRPRVPRDGHARRGPLVRICELAGQAAERAPRAIAVTAALFALTGVVVAIHARGHAVETDLRALATRSSAIDGIERLDNRLRAMDDRSSTPAVIATPDRADTRPLCASLNRRAHGDLAGIVVRCYALDDLFPDDLDRRAPVIAHLREVLDQLDLEELAPTDRTDFADLLRALAEPPPGDRDMPAALREYFVERDGSLGKLAYVDPVDENLEDNLYKLTDAIREIRLPSGKIIESSGELVVFADVLRAVRRDAKRLTLASALLVLLVLVLATRRLGTSLRVGVTLLASVAIMLGVAVVLGQKLNFFNFVALPTTFGIGIDYAINIEERIRAAPSTWQRGAIDAAVTEAGPAVVLASVTSMLGYGSLVIADSRALASFGALALIGELACVILAITVVPALWRLRRLPS